MSHEFGVSASYLCRIFKEKYGIIVLKYINTQRIGLASSFWLTRISLLKQL